MSARSAEMAQNVQNVQNVQTVHFFLKSADLKPENRPGPVLYGVLRPSQQLVNEPSRIGSHGAAEGSTA
jgi:hypothetical protein